MDPEQKSRIFSWEMKYCLLSVKLRTLVNWKQWVNSLPEIAKSKVMKRGYGLPWVYEMAYRRFILEKNGLFNGHLYGRKIIQRGFSGLATTGSSEVKVF